VVINAVDDQLLKGEQLDTPWSRGTIPVLPALLHEAKYYKRIVVITSDHGHVLDSGSVFTAGEGGERWRVAADAPSGQGELRVSGLRVVIPESKTLIAPWSENIRYGIKKNGYHGGVSPQEMVVPIAVLSPVEPFPDGWAEVSAETPSWWDEDVMIAAKPAMARTRPKPAKPKDSMPLFDGPEKGRGTAGPASGAASESELVAKLFETQIFKEQKALSGRFLPPEGVFRDVLVALDGRGGKLTSAALARSLNYPPTRLRGLLAVMQRVLNIDGFAVLTRDDASDTVELNRELLKRQFELR
jgi:hypothetical protein